MMMDSTFPGNHGMWRAINTPLWHTAFYVSIIAWEILTMILFWWGGLLMVRALRGGVSAFNHAKRVSLVALALSLTMWLVVFLSVGGEWFLMWQSKSWNGQEAAFSNVHGSRHRAVSRGSAGHCGPTVAAARFRPLVAITERTQGTAIPEGVDIWGNWGRRPIAHISRILSLSRIRCASHKNNLQQNDAPRNWPAQQRGLSPARR